MTREKIQETSETYEGKEVVWIYFENTHRKKGIKIECKQCGEETINQLSSYKRGGAKYCGKSCIAKHQNENRDYTGKNNPRYRGKEDYLKKLKDNSSCKYCEEERNPALALHHKENVEKVKAVSRMVGLRKYDLEDVKQEAEKCEIVCFNCHQVIHSDTPLTQRSESRPDEAVVDGSNPSGCNQ